MDEEKQCMLFSVTDTGTGIPEDKQELVFQRFEKLNEFVQGTGLGLSIARQVMDIVDGKIYLDTSYTGGTRMVVEWPA